MEERKVETYEESSIKSEQGFAFAYNLTMVSAVATVAMFVLGVALYLTVAR